MRITVQQVAELECKLEAYLSESLSHAQISVYAWEIAEQCPEKHSSLEELFWSIIFSIIHLADAEHWNDGCTQKDLGKLLIELKTSKLD